MPEDKSAIWAVLVGIFGAVEKITIELDGLKNRIEGSTPLSEEQIRRVEQEVRRRHRRAVAGRVSDHYQTLRSVPDQIVPYGRGALVMIGPLASRAAAGLDGGGIGWPALATALRHAIIASCSSRSASA